MISERAHDRQPPEHARIVRFRTDQLASHGDNPQKLCRENFLLRITSRKIVRDRACKSPLLSAAIEFENPIYLMDRLGMMRKRPISWKLQNRPDRTAWC
jgi:hypothetical protein